MSQSEYNVAPFRVKNLPFELIVNDYAYTMMIYISVAETEIFTVLKNDLNQLIERFNQLADARALGQKKGPILLAAHSWEILMEEDGRISIYLDAASPELLQKIVKGLVKYEQVKNVEMSML